MQRIIGTHKGKQNNTLIIVFAGVHGNEPAGVQALEELFRMLEREPLANPDFEFFGKIVGLRGNRQALAVGQRFLKNDLNRGWNPENLQRIRETNPAELVAEDLEMFELIQVLKNEIEAEQPENLILLDLHTTSAAGGIFTIPTEDAPSLRLAKGLHAPVILGLLDGISGTLLHFASDNHFAIGGFPKKTIAVAFEGGQHDDPDSVSRCIAATVNCLRACACVREQDVDSRHDAILQRYAADLPKVTRIRTVHHLRPGDEFVMRPGYQNFQKIEKNEWLADDVSGQILSPMDGRILMPLYQKLGSDGFFIVEEVF